MKSTIFALGLMIAIVAAGVANAQGLTAVNAINASWRSHTGSVTPVSLSSGTTTLDAEGNGVFTISFTATATDQDTSGAYITPTPSFICRVEQGSYGLAEYIGEDGGSMFFANFWHAPAENITITGFDPNDGSTKFQVEIPIDGQMNHFTLMRSDSEVQSFDFWCADAA